MTALPYGSPAHHSFITNVGLITSTGPHGENVMAAEWTHHISYEPGMIAVCLGPNKATAENILATAEFGVSIASTDQNVIASIAGSKHGKEYDKVAALKELGYQFLPGATIKPPTVEGARLRAECRLIDHRTYGDHIMFVGEVQRAETDESKDPAAYHKGKYWHVGENIPKPPQEEMERIKAVVERYRK
ncbi:MAG: hypothetical protein Greene041619_944 [Candidatus Peregrinibacteria bacterium Greene0416_19]|nr:MAG: hypothetical protein Greene041619_944 [Candidatus Peregrinibacteria bacterium Greene0416_19]